MDGLTDLTLVRTSSGGLARPEAPGTALTAQELVALARAALAPGDDLRILLEDGARNAATFGLVADGLGCDVLVSSGGGEWVLVQPPKLATGLPGWFDLSGGRVAPRTGLATLPLAGGLDFPGRDDFVVRRAAAATLGAGHPGLVTVGVSVRGGGFRISTYADSKVRTGVELAAALSPIRLYGGDLRLWLRWPDDAAEQRQLTRQVVALAQATGATVWTPDPGSEAVLLRGCRDLAARDRSGEITGWTAYRPPSMPGEVRYTSDRDGRLVPRSLAVVYGAGNVPLISTGREPAERLRARYADLIPEPGTMPVDMTILEDGRLALRLEDGSDLAVGTAELHALLEDVGWKGEKLLLLTPMPTDRPSGLRNHLKVLEAELGTEIAAAADLQTPPSPLPARPAPPPAKPASPLPAESAGRSANPPAPPPGRPAEQVVFWAGGGAWALIPEGLAPPTGEFLPLRHDLPAVVPGHRLVHLQVAEGEAIDVAASAAGLAGLGSATSRMPELVAAGHALVLPRSAWARARADQVLRADGTKWRVVAKAVDLPLADLFHR